MWSLERPAIKYLYGRVLCVVIGVSLAIGPAPVISTVDRSAETMMLDVAVVAEAGVTSCCLVFGMNITLLVVLCMLSRQLDI